MMRQGTVTTVTTTHHWHADLDWWEVAPSMIGSVMDMNGEPLDEPPALLVPDGAGGYREHRPEPKRRPMGFR